MTKDTTSHDLVVRARKFAEAVHYNQERGHTPPYPYIQHPEMVATVVSRVPGCTPEMLAAAWLHDVIEDADILPETLELLFGKEVTRMVIALSKPSNSDMARKQRCAAYNSQLAAAGPEVQTIKLADIIDNLSDIEDSGFTDNFIDQYIREKSECVEVLTKGDAKLRDIARWMAVPLFGDLSEEICKHCAEPNPSNCAAT